MTASVPSKMALATSLASARVGRGLVRIESSMSVAVTTGLPAARAVRISIFCTPGTCSSGISTPRSPRATMMPLNAATTAAACWTASGRSTLASTGTSRSNSLAAARSSAAASGVVGPRAGQADAQFRPRQVGEDGDLPQPVFGQGAESGDAGQVFVGGAVREVEAGDVEAGVEELFEDAGAVGGRPERGDDAR